MRSRVPGPLRVLIIGNPRTKERPLAYAAQEAEEIANSFAALAAETDGLLDFNRDRDALINAEVTREQLRELLRHGNYDIVHFAGHAAYNPERPGSSAWLLTDGRLSAQAIRNTLRWRDTQPWLVYANACEAGMDGAPPGTSPMSSDWRARSSITASASSSDRCGQSTTGLPRASPGPSTNSS